MERSRRQVMHLIALHESASVRPATYPGRVILYGTTQQTPEPGAKTDDGLERAEVQGEGDTYDQARTALDAAVPAGWRLTSVRRR